MMTPRICFQPKPPSPMPITSASARRRRTPPNPQRSAPLQWGCDPSSPSGPDRTPIRLALLAWLDERWRGDVYVPDELRPSCRRRSEGWPVIRGSRRRRNPPIAAGWAPRRYGAARHGCIGPSLAISSSRQPSEHVVHERFLCRGSVAVRWYGVLGATRMSSSSPPKRCRFDEGARALGAAWCGPR